MERTLDEDLAYGFRMLVDMAERSQSDSPFLDPTTAVQCLDRLHDGLRQLANRVIPHGRLKDGAGHLRVTIPDHGLGRLRPPRVRRDPAHQRRFSAGRTPDGRVLDDLLVVAPADRRPPIEQQRELLREMIGDASVARADLDFARRPDGQGIGVAASVKATDPASTDARL